MTTSVLNKLILVHISLFLANDVIVLVHDWHKVKGGIKSFKPNCRLGSRLLIMDFLQSTKIVYFIHMNVTIMTLHINEQAFQLQGYCRHK